jgi:hypothetical protein
VFRRATIISLPFKMENSLVTKILNMPSVLVDSLINMISNTPTIVKAIGGLAVGAHILGLLLWFGMFWRQEIKKEKQH